MTSGSVLSWRSGHLDQTRTRLEKFLVLPLGYSGSVPPGYFPAHSPTNRTLYIGRDFVVEGNVPASSELSARMRVICADFSAFNPSRELASRTDWRRERNWDPTLS